MKRLTVILSFMLLVACQNGDETDYETQIQQLTDHIEDQNEQIETLQQEVEDKTRELQQLRQENSSQSANHDANDQSEPSEDIPQTANFQLHSPQEDEQINDTFSVEGMIRYDALGSVRIELIDAAGNVVEESRIEENWFNSASDDREWTGIELNITITSSVTAGEGRVVVYDEQANENIAVPIHIQ
ncbi:Tfp pilus assembly protein PilP [Alkalibacillus flavidus]|uniref:Tfp pilus assembly protein PilP n=1 Tax=Alkalibacillus flavidus TaxID=546021 RepID=A0ABV2KXK8_9BACI